MVLLGLYFQYPIDGAVSHFFAPPAEGSWGSALKGREVGFELVRSGVNVSPCGWIFKMFLQLQDSTQGCSNLPEDRLAVIGINLKIDCCGSKHRERKI